jgi:chemotaxis protein methyltransferase CheR
MPNPPPATLIQTASALIEARTGLSSHAQMRVNLEEILSELASGDLAAFVKSLRATPDSAPAWQKLMRALVIGETYYFRNRAHFQLLGDLILPDLSTRRKNLNIWSAGCATGEETYSIAMTLYEHLPDLTSRTVNLVGTDINNHAINAARHAVYRAWAFRQTDTPFRMQYFDGVTGGFRVKQFIRSTATFRQANLLTGPPLPQLDVIFCCNVLLYFEESAVERVENLLFDALAPGGWLIFGQAEAVHSQRERWTTHIFPGAVAYQKPLAAVSTPTVWKTDYHTRPASATESEEGVNTPPVPLVVRRDNAPRPQPQPYLDAVNHFRLKHYIESETILASLLAQQPGHAAAHVLTACLYANRGSMRQAQQHLDTALQLDSLQADAHYLKGLLLLEDGEDEPAVDSFRAALYCKRGHPLAAMILGNVHVQRGETARARRIWAEALEALNGMPPDNAVCDLSDMTAESISSFLNSQLSGLVVP